MDVNNVEFLSALQDADLRSEVVNKSVQQSSLSFRAGTGNETKIYFDTVEELSDKLKAMADNKQGIKDSIVRIREALQEVKN